MLIKVHAQLSSRRLLYGRGYFPVLSDAKNQVPPIMEKPMEIAYFRIDTRSAYQSLFIILCFGNSPQSKNFQQMANIHGSTI